MPLEAYMDLVPAQPDERGNARRCLKLEASGSLASGEIANVTIHNASTSGLLLETELPLGEREALLVDLPQAGTVLARTVWSSGKLIGCKFDKEIKPSVLSALELKSNAPFSVALGLSTSDRGEAAASFGKRIEQLRKTRGLTLADVAAELGVSKPTVWAWEKGKARPIEDRIPALAEILRVSPSDLVARSMAPNLAEAVLAARKNIAATCGVDLNKVRIMIDL